MSGPARVCLRRLSQQAKRPLEQEVELIKKRLDRSRIKSGLTLIVAAITGNEVARHYGVHKKISTQYHQLKDQFQRAYEAIEAQRTQTIDPHIPGTKDTKSCSDSAATSLKEITAYKNELREKLLEALRLEDAERIDFEEITAEQRQSIKQLSTQYILEFDEVVHAAQTIEQLKNIALEYFSDKGKIDLLKRHLAFLALVKPIKEDICLESVDQESTIQENTPLAIEPTEQPVVNTDQTTSKEESYDIQQWVNWALSYIPTRQQTESETLEPQETTK